MQVQHSGKVARADTEKRSSSSSFARRSSLYYVEASFIGEGIVQAGCL